MSVSVVVVGFGGVGRALCRRLGEERARLAQAAGAPVRLAAVGDTSGFASVGGLDALLDHKEAGGRLVDLGGQPLTWPEGPGVLVDTAVGDTGSLWRTALDRGWGVVSANKTPLAGPGAAWSTWEPAWRDGRLGVGGTVGAGVPSAELLNSLRAGGDRATRIAGVVSGTMSTVLGDLAQGAALSEAVERARRAGITEPDPVLDLSGRDVGRKLLILGRLAGLWGPDDEVPVSVEPVVDPRWEGLVPDELQARLRKLDRVWQARAQAAGRSGRRMRYVGTADADGVRCGLQALPAAEPLGRLAPTENGVVLWTERFPETPATVTGPGMGRDVTASTLLADLARVAGRVRA